jgi:acyl-CoA synthetase (AMP-forming)/AMP-acid ligase II
VVNGGIAGAARRSADAPALILGDEVRSFARFDAANRRVAGLLARHGVQRRDRIAVFSANRLEVLEVSVGALRAGIVPVPISPLLTPAEVRYLLEDSGTLVLFCDRDVRQVPGGVRLVVHFDDDYAARLAGAPEAGVADHTLGRPMHYTSGTTGRPKGVWVEPGSPGQARARSEDFAGQWGITPDDVHIVCSPLTHSAPQRYAIRTLEAGGSVVVQERFDAAAALERIERFGATSTFMVPTHLERIFALDEAERDRSVSSMRMLAHAGAPIRESTKRKALGFFPEGSVWEFYGSTEGGFTRISPREWLERPGARWGRSGCATPPRTASSTGATPTGRPRRGWTAPSASATWATLTRTDTSSSPGGHTTRSSPAGSTSTPRRSSSR